MVILGGAGQLIVAILFAQRRLEELARRRVGEAFDEDDLVRQPPFGDMAGKMVEDRLGRDQFIDSVGVALVPRT